LDKAAWRAQRAHVTVPISTQRVVARAARSVQREPIRIHKSIVKQRHDVCTASLPRTLATFDMQQVCSIPWLDLMRYGINTKEASAPLWPSAKIHNIFTNIHYYGIKSNEPG